MSEAPEQQPVVETQQPAADPGADFAAQVELLKAKNAELIGERRKDKEKFEALEARLTELQDRSTKQRQAKLAESGEHKKLWEEAQKTVAEREAELADLRSQMEQQSARAVEQQVRATATAAMAQQGVFAPDQLYMLMAQKLKMPESGADYMFRGNGSVGMGSVGSSGPGTGMNNPYISGNFTEIVKLETENPELAKRMKAQAKQ